MTADERRAKGLLFSPADPELGSIVTRDIPDRSFAAGNPCRVIRTIGPEDSIMNQPERLGGYRSMQ